METIDEARMDTLTRERRGRVQIRTEEPVASQAKLNPVYAGLNKSQIHEATKL